MNESIDDKRIIIIPFDLLQRVNVVSPSKYFIFDAVGNKIFFKCRSKATAQELVDTHYGKGKYTVLVEGVIKSVGNVTAK